MNELYVLLMIIGGTTPADHAVVLDSSGYSIEECIAAGTMFEKALNRQDLPGAWVCVDPNRIVEGRLAPEVGT